MLYLGGPFAFVNGVACLPDSQSPLDWYVLPTAPEFVTVPDPGTGLALPKFDLLRYTGAADAGGLLAFDVRCTVAPERLNDVARELQHLVDLPGRPRLTPAPLTGGTVSLMLFDLGSGQVPDPGRPVHFARSISHSASPALYGDNESTFRVQLDPAGVTALEAAMHGDLSPIGVVYALEFLALRPAYAVTLTVDWDRVQERLDETFGIDAMFFGSQIEEAVDKLVDDRLITLTADTFVPEDEDAEAVLARRDRAVDEVRDMITQAFFEPSINPAAEPPDGWDKVTELANSVSRLAVTGGLSSFAGFTYKNAHYSRIDAKTLGVSMSERTTVRRRIYPQGSLSGMFRGLAAAGVDPGRFVQDVRLDDDLFFRRRRLTVVPRVDFARDHVTSVDVRLAYADEPPRNVVFEPGSAPAVVDWPQAVAAGRRVDEVGVGYTVNLAAVPGTDRPASVTAPAAAVTGDVAEILGRQVYEIVPVTITSLGVPWDRYPRVEVALRYEDDAHGIVADDTVVLDAARPEATWDLFTVRGGPRTYTYALTYRGADFREVVRPPQGSDDTTVTVPAPFPAARRRVVEVLPVADWTQVRTLFVDWRYTDPRNDVREDGSLTFTAADDAPRTFGVDLADAAARVVDYRVTWLDAAGQFRVAPPSQTMDRRIVARPGMPGHRVVPVVPAGADFAAAGVEKVTVELRRSVAGESAADTVTLGGPGDRGAFEFDYADEAHAGFEFRLTTSWANGLTSRSDWAAADGGRELVVPVGNAR